MKAREGRMDQCRDSGFGVVACALVCGKMWREGGQEKRSLSEARRRDRQQGGSSHHSPFLPLPPEVVQVATRPCWWPGRGAEGQVSVCYLGPGLCWAWGAKQPWGQETTSEWV